MPNQQPEPNPKKPTMRILVPPALSAKLRQYYELGSAGKVDPEAIASVIERLQTNPAYARRLQDWQEHIGQTVFKMDEPWGKWPEEPEVIAAVGVAMAVLFRIQVEQTFARLSPREVGAWFGRFEDYLDNAQTLLIAMKEQASAEESPENGFKIAN